jgi:hypothetical protein
MHEHIAELKQDLRVVDNDDCYTGDRLSLVHRPDGTIGYQLEMHNGDVLLFTPRPNEVSAIPYPAKDSSGDPSESFTESERRCYVANTVAGIESRTEVPYSQAELIGSRIVGSDKHLPILTIDYAARLLPSRSARHFHLYLDRPISWKAYKRLMRSMSRAGLMERGYVRMAIARGQSFVRVQPIVAEESLSSWTDDFGRPYYRTDTELSSDGYYYDARSISLEVRRPAARWNATLVGSRRTDGLHLPVLDLDYAAKLVPSSTMSRSCLYLDCPVTWKAYGRFMRAMSRAGLLNPDFYYAARSLKETFARIEHDKTKSPTRDFEIGGTNA